ncbi:MAG: glycosyltransferase family 4 protein [Candidatus Micrarchaeia archaeon]
MEEVIHNLSIALLKNNIEPYVFAPRVRGMDNNLDFEYKVLRFSRPSSKKFGLRQLLLPLLWYHWIYRFDILHCHGVYPPGYVGISFNKLTGVPVVITSHGGDIKKNINNQIINRRITSRILKTFSEAQAVTAISYYMREQILELNASPDKVYLIPNGIQLNEFKYFGNKASLSKESYILYLGRLVQVKGVDILIQAFSKMIAQHPEIRLKIAGEGREIDNLIKLADDLRVKGNIDFLGFIRGEEKIRLLSKALFLVLPSQREGFPVVILEAFASGLPVIASRVGGISDIIRDGVNGFLVPSGDIEEFAKKMSLLIKNDILRKRFALKALATVNSYDWSIIVKKYIDVYQQILGNSSHSTFC